MKNEHSNYLHIHLQLQPVRGKKTTLQLHLSTTCHAKHQNIIASWQADPALEQTAGRKPKVNACIPKQCNG
eukprot:583004-Amphidinium_carterae.1